MRLATMIAIVSIASSAFADSASLRRAIESGRGEVRPVLEAIVGYAHPSKRVETAVSKAVLALEEPDEVVATVAKTLAVTPKAASALIEAHVRSIIVGMEGGDPQIVDQLARVAVREAPRNRDVLAFYMSLAPEMDDDEFAATYLPLIRSLPQADDAAIVAGVVNFGGSRSIIIAADALNRDPENASLQGALTRDADSALSAAFGPVRFEGDKASFRESWKGVAPGQLAWDAASQIAALASTGRAADVLADFDALPKSIRDVLAGGALHENNHSLDLRLTLAACAVLGGDAARAKTIIANVRPVNAEHPDPRGDQPYGLRMLQALLAPELDEDVYDILAEAIRGDARPGGGVWSAVFAALAKRGGYDVAGSAVLRTANRSEQNDLALIAEQYLPQVLRVELQITLDRNAASIAALHASPAGEVPDEAVQNRLARPRIEPFTSKKLPSWIKSNEAVAIEHGDARLTAMHIPPGWYPIRMEQTGDEVWGVAVSQSLDPVSDGGSGAYWVLHSSNGGRSWDAPLYTGLRQYPPYVVAPESKLPLFHGDHLEVEVVGFLKIDPESIDFPSEERRVKHEGFGLYLELPLETLRRDSDGDGITDLVEERIVTDSTATDTDGDGIADSDDGLPGVALSDDKSAESEVLAAVLRSFPPAVGGAALFLVGDRSLFAPIDIHRRVIVLTRGEMEMYEEKFGPTTAADLSFILVRHDGEKALVVLSEPWKADVFELTKTNDGWSVKKAGG